MKIKPHTLFLLIAVVLVFASFFLDGNNTFDLNLHDTYFVISASYIFRLVSILYLIIWALYLLANKILYSKALTWVHLIIATFAVVFFISNSFFKEDFVKPVIAKRLYDRSNLNLENGKMIFRYTITVFLFLFGQSIFFINLIAGLFKKKVQSTYEY